MRLRVIVYGLVLLTLLSILSFSIATRSAVKLDVLRDRNSLYRENSAGQIENIYTLKLTNKQNADHEFLISASGIEELDIKMFVPAGEIKDIIVRLIVDPENLNAKSTDVEFKVIAVKDESISTTQQARFLGPE